MHAPSFVKLRTVQSISDDWSLNTIWALLSILCLGSLRLSFMDTPPLREASPCFLPFLLKQSTNLGGIRKHPINRPARRKAGSGGCLSVDGASVIHLGPPRRSPPRSGFFPGHDSSQYPLLVDDAIGLATGRRRYGAFHRLVRTLFVCPKSAVSSFRYMSRLPRRTKRAAQRLCSSCLSLYQRISRRSRRRPENTPQTRMLPTVAAKVSDER
jgi:hypothetical protein